jgi:CHAT domain/SIR2-like domain
MAHSVDLEIGLHRRDGQTWTVELQCQRSDQDVDVRLVRDGPSFDLDQLRRHAADVVAYGRLLTDTLFAVDDVRQQFAMARAAAASQNRPLRLRLFIGPNAPELHDVRWETLRDPDRDAPLLTDEQILFSRYLSSMDWRPVGVRPRVGLRALAVIANPSDLHTWHPDNRRLDPVDVAGELERAKAALHPVVPAELASGGRATLDELVARLHDRPGYDILYIVCHGFLARGEPQLLLETANGTAARVPGSALADRLHDLRTRPRLVVLASCQSAGHGTGLRSDDGGALAALGPRLAEAGIPAVLAMQGNITMKTMGVFVPRFFRELLLDGQIDRALAVARGAVRDQPDWSVPVLFMRLKTGRIWYSPGFSEAFDKWPALFADIRQGRCTPILGPSLNDGLIGTREEIAWKWASIYHFPLAPHAREDLAHVAQYLATSLNYRFPRESLREYLRVELIERYELPEALHDASLDELVKAAGERRRAVDPAEPHAALAAMPFPLYVTSDPADLLPAALTVQGKDPQVELCRWSDDIDWPPSIYELAPDYRPEVRRPLVYHLFGHLAHPDTVALTYDDYDDFLIGVTSNRDLIPAVVRRALNDSALLFLGYRIDQVDFRVLFRTLMRQQGRGRRRRYAHVAVQIDPEESTTLEPDRARRYMQEYFGGADISIYWGSVESFVRELQRGWEEEPR